MHSRIRSLFMVSMMIVTLWSPIAHADNKSEGLLHLPPDSALAQLLNIILPSEPGSGVLQLHGWKSLHQAVITTGQNESSYLVTCSTRLSQGRSPIPHKTFEGCDIESVQVIPDGMAVKALDDLLHEAAGIKGTVETPILDLPDFPDCPRC